MPLRRGATESAPRCPARSCAIRRWYTAEPTVPLRPLIELALRQLATACSQPRYPAPATS